MRIRFYEPDVDFQALQRWAGDERTHQLWCAGRIPYPLERESFDSFLANLDRARGERPFVAAGEDGTSVGFFCAPTRIAEGEAMLKFIIIAPECRGRGIGREMVSRAAARIFAGTNAEAVQLNVFSVNAPAIRCYEKAGFVKRRITENAFAFHDELWGRCNMAVSRAAAMPAAGKET